MIFNSHSLLVVFVRNRVLLENLVASLEKHSSVSVLQEKEEQTVRKRVGTTFKVLPEEKSLSLHLIHFYYPPSLLLSAHTVEIYYPFTEIFVLHAAVHIYLVIPCIKIFDIETCVYLR